MKKSKFLLVLAMVLLFSALAYAAFESNIRDTKHNLSRWANKGYSSATVDEICVFCHTPHNAPTWPLWNRNLSSNTYAIYSSKVFNAATLGENMSLDSYTKLCMSCHESLNNVANLGPNKYQYQKAKGNTAVNRFATPSGLSQPTTSMLGTDLMDDHPVGFNYEKAAGKYPLHDKIAVVSALGYNGVPSKVFPDDKMSCVSCHDVHGKIENGGVIPILLKKANGSSQLCLACHKK